MNNSKKKQSNILFLSALEQAKLIKQKQISPLELTKLYLANIERENPNLACFRHVAIENAIADAKTKTEQLALTSDTQELPLLFGVTIAIKDLDRVAQMPISYGVSALQNNLANSDDVIVSKLKNAGLTILGKTATSQLGSLPYTEPPGFPPTLNPHHPDYTSGGSSGGSAAAVAAGLCSVAQGNDGGGSVRGPAFCCGVVGLKPSRGRVSYAPLGDYQNGIATQGVLSRTVADSAAILDIISGYVPGDPYWLENPPISFLKATKQKLSALRIGLIETIKPVAAFHPHITEALQQTAQQLEHLGHRIEPVSLDITELIEPFKTIWSAGVASASIPQELLSPMNQWIASQAGEAGAYLQAVTKMQIFSRRLINSLVDYDVLLSPTYIHPPIKIRQWANLSPQETLDKIINWIMPCPIWNATGQPAIAIPVPTSDRLPTGVQLIGQPAAEATILALAHQLKLNL